MRNVLLVVGLLLGFCGGSGDAQTPLPENVRLENLSRPQLTQLYHRLAARMETLSTQIEQERARVHWYLTYADEILQMQRSLGELQGDPGQQLVTTGQYVYNQSFTAAEWQQLLQNHYAVATRYFGWIGQSAGHYPALHQELQAAWQQYAWKIQQAQSVNAELAAASRILAQASGNPSLAADFQGTQQRVTETLRRLEQPPAAVSARPLIVENRTRQRVYLWLCQPADFTQPVASYWLDPGRRMEVTYNSQRMPVTPEWGLAAKTHDERLAWALRKLGDYVLQVDQNGFYSVILTEP